MRNLFFLAVLASLLLACDGRRAGGGFPVDSGARIDTGVTVDGGGSSDSGAGRDSIATEDSGGLDVPVGTDSGMAGGACLNASDNAAISSTYTVDGVSKGVEMIAQDRGTSCFIMGRTGADLQMCAEGGIHEDTRNAISPPCTTCYARVVVCAAENCAAACIDGGDDCTACRCGENPSGINCAVAFSECSGIPDSTCF